MLAPAVLAGVLVVVLAAQSVRAVQGHRQLVTNGLKDYAAFAAWQYTRRASDYIRLVLITTLREQLDRSEGRTYLCQSSSSECPAQAVSMGLVSCSLDSAKHVQLERNTTAFDDELLRQVLTRELATTMDPGYSSGVTSVTSQTPDQVLGYWFSYDGAKRAGICAAAPMSLDAMLPVLKHVAGFAPLLPPTLVGKLPNDSLVSIEVTASDGTHIARVGTPTIGISASDVLGPNLNDMRVIVTLHPAASERLIAGGISPSNTYELVALLILTLLMGMVAIRQLRRGEEMVQLRNDFVASISHELKTPLAQISLFADTLATPRERTPRERSEYLGIISREAKRLGQLVDSILLFAGLTRADGASRNPEPTLLGEEIRAAVSAFEPLAAARQSSILTDFTTEIELPLDRSAFRQLMLNALDNALKFGPDGQQIAVRVRIVGAFARISVEDQGSGVPERERQSVFEPFVRIDRPNARGGSGIGLAVVSEVVRSHGGTVSMAEASTGGARLEILLPGAHAMLDEPALVQ